MADSWEKRSLPYGPGYNSPPDPELEFTVTYDADDDVVTIDSNIPFFDAVGALYIHLDSDAGQFILANGQYVQVTPSQVTFGDASDLGSVLEEIEFFETPGPSGLLATWTGSVSVTP